MRSRTARSARHWLSPRPWRRDRRRSRRTRAAPSFTAATARIPLPVPMSSTRAAGARARGRAPAARGSPRCCRDARCRRPGPARSRARRGKGRRDRPPTGGSTRRRSPMARGGKDCCQALAHAASRSGVISASSVRGKPSERSDAQYPRTAVRSVVEEVVSGKKARRRAGSGGTSSSTTPRAPCSQRKLVSPSAVSVEVGNGELPERHQVPKSFFIRSTNFDSRGPASSSDTRRNSSSNSFWRAERRVGTSTTTS